MNPLNDIMIDGNLVRDPQLKETPKGTPVCSFSVASNRYYRQEDENKQEVSFFDIETWSDTAKRCAETLQKGRGVRIKGRLKQDRWEDKEGKIQNRIKIVADKVEFKPQFSGNDQEEAQNEGADEKQEDMAEVF